MPIAHTRPAILAFILGLAATGPGAAQDRQPASTPEVRFPGNEVTLALENQGGRSIVEVRIGEGGPYRFIIDTGAGVSVLDAGIAAALGLEVVGRTAAGVPGGEMVDADIVRVPSMRFGDAEVVGARPLVLDLAGITGGLIQGVLGMELFREVLLTLDPARGRAAISRGQLVRGEPGVLSLDGSMGRIAFDIDVAGRAVPVEIDTGSPAEFTLPIDLIEEVPTLDEPEQRITAGLVGGARDVRVRRLDGAIRFAGLTFERPRVGFMAPAPVMGNIGSGILDGLVTRIDQAHGLIGFAASAGQPEAGRGPRRLGLVLGGPGATDLSRVASVDPGGLADRAGFRAGDTIVTLNGRAIAEYDQASLGTLLRSSEPLIWEIERDGQRQVIRIR